MRTQFREGKSYKLVGADLKGVVAFLKICALAIEKEDKQTVRQAKPG
jgi:hypothetical protein